MQVIEAQRASILSLMITCISARSVRRLTGLRASRHADQPSAPAPCPLQARIHVISNGYVQ